MIWISAIGSILDRKHADDVCQLRENDKICARLETSPRKALVQLVHQMSVCIINTLILSGNEALFHLSGCVNSQNNGYLSAENSMLINTNDIKVCVC